LRERVSAPAGGSKLPSLRSRRAAAPQSTSVGQDLAWRQADSSRAGARARLRLVLRERGFAAGRAASCRWRISPRCRAAV